MSNQSLEPRIESSLLYLGNNGKQNFVHDSYMDYFLAKGIVKYNTDVTHYIPNEGWRKIILFYAGIIEDGTEFIRKMLSFYKPVSYSGNLTRDAMDLPEKISSIEFLLFVSQCILESRSVNKREIDQTSISLGILDTVANLIVPLASSGWLGLNELIEKIEPQFCRLAYEDETVIKRAITYCREGTHKYGGTFYLPTNFLTSIAGDNDEAFDCVRRIIYNSNNERCVKAIKALGKANSSKAVDILTDITYGGENAKEFWGLSGILESSCEPALKSLLSIRHPKAAEVVDDLLLNGGGSPSRRQNFALFVSDRNLKREGIQVSEYVRRVIEKYKHDEDPIFCWLINDQKRSPT